jgi:hypothetical protein
VAAPNARGLSRTGLDKHVDKFWQVLYGPGKPLIYKDNRCIAYFLGKPATGFPAPCWTIMWISFDKSCMGAPSA